MTRDSGRPCVSAPVIGLHTTRLTNTSLVEIASSDTSDCTAVKGEGSSKKQSLKSRKAPTKVRRRVRPVSDEDAAKIRRRRKNTTLKDIDRDTRLRRALALSDDEKRTVQRRRRSFSSEESTKEDDDSEPESLAKERPRRGRSRTVSRPVLDPVDETSEAEGRSRAKDTPAKKPRAVTDEEGETKDNGSNTESNSTRSSSRSSRSRSPQSRRCPCGRMVADKDGSSSESSHSDNESGDKAEAKTTKRKSAPVADEKDKPKEDKERSAEEETEAASAKDDGSSDVKDDNSEMDTEPVVTEEEDGEIMPVVDEMDLSDSVNVVNDEPVKKEATKDDSEETSRASEKKPALETVAEEADREGRLRLSEYDIILFSIDLLFQIPLLLPKLPLSTLSVKKLHQKKRQSPKQQPRRPLLSNPLFSGCRLPLPHSLQRLHPQQNLRHSHPVFRTFSSNPSSVPESSCSTHTTFLAMPIVIRTTVSLTMKPSTMTVPPLIGSRPRRPHAVPRPPTT